MIVDRVRVQTFTYGAIRKTSTSSTGSVLLDPITNQRLDITKIYADKASFTFMDGLFQSRKIPVVTFTLEDSKGLYYYSTFKDLTVLNVEFTASEGKIEKLELIYSSFSIYTVCSTDRDCPSGFCSHGVCKQRELVNPGIQYKS